MASTANRLSVRSTKSGPENSTGDRLRNGFAIVFGLFLGLSLLKFGTPAILEVMVESPTNGYEWLLNSWPVAIGYWSLGGLVVVGLIAARWKTGAPPLLVALPLGWLGWQFVAGTQSVDVVLTHATLKHFTAGVACFYVGLLVLSQSRQQFWIWIGLLGGFLLVVAAGLQQHFGGLAETRRYFFVYVYPTLKAVPPEYLKKMSSDRIFATLFYPNALAGVLLLLLPALLTLIWREAARWLTAAARGFLIGAVGLAALACLYWSGSKGGWLLMLLLALIVLLRLEIGRRYRVLIISGMLVLGLAGFFWKYSSFFQRGATSVVARFDYWRAALETTKANPAFGSGPGTFSVAYKKVKKPESEMARLVHNDYLEQASDSGVFGFLTYLTWIVGSLVFLYWKGGLTGDPVRFSVWLGLLGWGLQGLLEFGLYIPALAWPAFSLLGSLLGQETTNRIDNPPPPA